MGTDGYQIYCGDHFKMYANVKSLSNIPGINIIMHINYIFTLKIKRKKERKHEPERDFRK